MPPLVADLRAEQFVAHKFDLKWLICELVSSQTYQLADAGDPRAVLPLIAALKDSDGEVRGMARS